MKKLLLISLTLTNFKGCNSLTVLANGQDLSAFGDNGVGKTTLADAYYWLLTGKDSNNKAKFDIQTLVSGSPVHNLEHSVEAVHSLDGKEIRFKRTLVEKYQTIRSGADKVFGGFTTKYEVNEVPVNETEYNAAVRKVCDEKLWRLLTDPNYFPSTMTWQDRRKMLIEVCGDVSDEDVIASNTKLKDLPKVLEGKTIEDYKKVMAARRPKIKDELQVIPAQINENRNMMPAESTVVYDLEDLNRKLSDAQTRRASMGASTNLTEKQSEVQSAKSVLQSIEFDLKKVRTDEYSKKDGELRTKQSEATKAFQDLERAKGKLKGDKEKIAEYIQLREELRAKLEQIDGEVFTFEEVEACPTCGQCLPSEKVAEARQTALAAFNLSKSNRLEAIQQQGIGYKTKQEELEATLESQEIQISELITLEADANQVCADLNANLATLRNQVPNFEAIPKYKDQLDVIARLEIELSGLKTGNVVDYSAIDREISGLEQQIRDARTASENNKQRTRLQARIEELEKNQQQLAAESDKLDQGLYLVEEFTRTKVSALTLKINSKFELVSFKLFEDQVNGGISECCEATINGRPFNSALSNAERINAGLAIINTLARHFEFVPPIFIDNAESVTSIRPTEGQQIRLIVSETDKTLRFLSSDIQELLPL